MFFLYVVLVIWGGYETRPSPWVMVQGTFNDQASCSAAAKEITTSPVITSPQPQAPSGMAGEIDAFCAPSSTPPGQVSATIAHTARRWLGPTQ